MVLEHRNKKCTIVSGGLWTHAHFVFSHLQKIDIVFDFLFGFDIAFRKFKLGPIFFLSFQSGIDITNCILILLL